ncbi:hypothetical protein SUZIE_169185 [Sciurus carolinensis]|uniref:KIAA0825 n=1 Tax=Sciurus carolinensis TaxID=30640 RepID=A0AA41N3D9_SCICA|nr:hypothetical protein [Sciurus carolinensis]
MDWVDEYSHNSFDLQCLLNSFPGDLEFKQIFSDIDEQIEQNATSIECCIKEIESEVNKQCPDVQLQTSTDCFEWLTSYHNTSKSPSIPRGDLIEFLKILQDLLKNEQNQEEMILDLLWDLSCQSSVSFPSDLSETSLHFLSRTSLHSVEDHSSVDVKSIWDDIRLHLRRFLVSRLQSYNEINNSQQKMVLKNQCIQQLLFLYPESEVIIKYQNIQNKLLVKLLQNCFPSYSGDSNLDVMAHGFQSTMLILYSMIKEDFDTLYEILAPSSTVKFIKETYLDTVTEEVAKFLEKFCELRFKENTVRVVKTSKSSSKHRGAVHALVTPECPRTGRNLSLSLDELKFLSYLIKSFLKLENDVQELFEEIFLLFKMSRNASGIVEKSNREIIIEKPKINKTSIPSEQLLPGKECSDIMEKLDTMLPLALACRDDSFQEIRANLVEACCKVATAVLARLQERGKEVPSKAPLKNLHILLSTAVYIFQHFMHYDNLMEETTKKPIFLVPVQRYQEFINTLQFQVTDYCVRVCATSILQDAESHHWDDYKAFYEERTPRQHGAFQDSLLFSSSRSGEHTKNIYASMCMESELEVIRCLRLALTDAIKDTVQQVISVMSYGRNCEKNLNKHSVPDHLLKSIPKEWSYIPKETQRKDSSKYFTRLAAQAVSIVISKLPTVIACLPPPIKYFFFLSEKKMSRNFVELKKAGLLAWNLIVLICHIFKDGNKVELLTGASLDRWSKEKLGLICVCLESIMGEQSSPNPMTQKVIQSIEQQKPKWIEHQLLKARKLSTECAFMTMEKSTVLEEGDTALELTEQKINMMVLDVCHKPGGSEYLRQIYHIMRLNEEYLKEQLFSMNGSEEKPLPIRPLKTTLSSVETQPSAFNPFHVHKVFSEDMLDQVCRN